MLLAIDIGNTNINLGVFRGRKLLRRYSLPTQRAADKRFLKKIIARHKIEASVISSVVPAASVKLKPALRGVRLYNIGKEIKVPLVNRYRNPAQVGQDRLVSAYAGLALYGAPLIIADFGTAVNFDIISKKGEFLGGLILPGLRTALQALAQKTALLPEVQLKPPRELVGRDTQNGMLSGIVHGYACLTNELCRKLKKQLGKNTGVVATGGDSGLIAKYVKTFSALERNLTLKGLNLLFLKKTS